MFNRCVECRSEQDHLVYPDCLSALVPYGRTMAACPLTEQSVIHTIKPLAISTGPLKTFLSLHFPPIDLVVYQGPSIPKETETSSRGGLHA